MAAGDWCWAAPLWANALLPNNHDPQDAAVTVATDEATEETNTADPDFAPGVQAAAATRRSGQAWSRGMCTSAPASRSRQWEMRCGSGG
jgi:hypothetical protein